MRRFAPLVGLNPGGTEKSRFWRLGAGVEAIPQGGTDEESEEAREVEEVEEWRMEGGERRGENVQDEFGVKALG